MLKKRVKLKYNAERGYYVDLPSYSFVKGTHQPVTANLIHADGVYPQAAPAAVLALNPTVEVLLPAEDCKCGTPATEIDTTKIRERYLQWANRAAPDV